MFYKGKDFVNRPPRAFETGNIQIFAYNKNTKSLTNIGCTFNVGRGTPMLQIVKDPHLPRVYVPNQNTYDETLEAAERVFRDAGYEIVNEAI